MIAAAAPKKEVNPEEELDALILALAAWRVTLRGQVQRATGVNQLRMRTYADHHKLLQFGKALLAP